MLSYLLDIIAPESCLECHQEGSIWCDWCRLQQESLPSRCFLCHAQTKDYAVCKKCQSKTNLKAVYVFGEYKETNKNLVTALKFDCKRHAAVPIAKSMLELVPYFSDDVVFVPVPSSPARVRQRGFDHTSMIIKELARQGSLPTNKLLIRTNDVRQVGATKAERKKQIERAFRLKRSVAKLPRHVVLVDDVITTGATLSVAAKVLKRAGVKRVDALTFAYSK